MQMNRIAAILKALRGTRTQTELAKAAGVSRSIVSNIENGKNFEGKNLLKILDALGISADALTAQATPEERQIHTHLQELLQAGEPWSEIRHMINGIYAAYSAEQSNPPTPKKK